LKSSQGNLSGPSEKRGIISACLPEGETKEKEEFNEERQRRESSQKSEKSKVLFGGAGIERRDDGLKRRQEDWQILGEDN